MPRPGFSPTRLARNGASRSSWRIGPAPRARSASARSWQARTIIRCCTRVAGSVTVAPMLVEKLPYDVNHDLVPISATTAIVLMLAVSNQLSVNSIPELIAALRASPGKYAWTSGPTLPRYIFSAFLKQHDLKMNFVSYRDASQPQADLGEGRIQALLTSLTASSSPVQAGKARFLAVVEPKPRRHTARRQDRSRIRISRA